MLPIFVRARYGNGFCIKPLLQVIFEQLYRNGFREFCFIIGRGKRVIEDHFTIDRDFIKQLVHKGKYDLSSILEEFYEMIEDSRIVWINQPEPRGFGHAVLMARSFIRDEPFIVHAGDTYILSKKSNPLKRLITAHEKQRNEATLLLKSIENPKQYGVAEIGEQTDGSIRITRVVEKPEIPQSNLAIMPIYVFNPLIMQILEETRPSLNGEIQLTDGIQAIIEKRLNVRAVKLEENERRLDVGLPSTYWEALSTSHNYSKRKTSEKL